MRRATQWRARLFFQGVSPMEIESMDYFLLRHWGEMSEIKTDAEARAVKEAQKK
jgi:hypothetical protein